MLGIKTNVVYGALLYHPVLLKKKSHRSSAGDGDADDGADRSERDENRDNFYFPPPSELEVVVQGRHAEQPFPFARAFFRPLEPAHLENHRENLRDENQGDDEERENGPSGAGGAGCGNHPT